MADVATATAPAAVETASAPDFTQKHPLEHTWTLWYDNPKGQGQGQATWGQTLRSVYTFNTIEDFWCLYNNVLAPSRLAMGTEIHLFKEGIEPKWEDVKCAKAEAYTRPLFSLTLAVLASEPLRCVSSMRPIMTPICTEGTQRVPQKALTLSWEWTSVSPCAKGGKWTFFFPKSKEPSALDDCWQGLTLVSISAQPEPFLILDTP